MIKLKNIIFLFIFTTLCCCKNEKTDFYKTAVLENGFPDVLQPLKKDLPFDIIGYTALDAKNDSIDAYFGKLQQGAHSGYWFALSAHGRIKQFRTIDVIPQPETEKENNFDIEFNDSENRISFRIRALDTLHNTISYSWRDHSGFTDTLVVRTIDQPLQKGNTFPEIRLTRPNGEIYPPDHFKDRIVVINWWAVSCAPCREEIPG